MNLKARWVKVLSPVLAAWMMLVTMQPVHAGLVSTTDVLAQQQADQARDKLATALAREEVREELARLGADLSALDQRLAALSDEDVRALAARLDTLPAGGDVLGVAVFLFLVLLLTDILGYTDVFPFVKKTVQ